MDNFFCSIVILCVLFKKFGFILLFSVICSNKYYEFLRVMNRIWLFGCEFIEFYIMGYV